MVPSCFWFCASCFLILIPFWFFWFLIDPECWVVGLNKSDKSHSWPFGARFPMENLIESFVWSADWARQNPHTHTHHFPHREAYYWQMYMHACISPYIRAYIHACPHRHMHTGIQVSQEGYASCAAWPGHWHDLRFADVPLQWVCGLTYPAAVAVVAYINPEMLEARSQHVSSYWIETGHSRFFRHSNAVYFYYCGSWYITSKRQHHAGHIMFREAAGS